MDASQNSPQTSVEPKKIFLKDYQIPSHQVSYLKLHFDLGEEVSIVSSKMELKGVTGSPVILDGENLKLLELKVNGQILGADQFSLSNHTLEFISPADRFEVEIKTELQPQLNTSLEGLYRSNGIFCTQCEAQGFRKITYFFDRPDVMTQFTVTLEADARRYPILLSNGNRIETEPLALGRQRVTWQDPFKKPCYLFAMVAGDLGVITDHYITSSGRRVQLEIYAAHGEQSRCQFAMESLKKSMKWDEERFGREYDLDTYMILAVDDFNAGAMENKGLNIFNSRLIFANPETATDADYFAIESVVAHEYFHNWTGNRVTLRDWFHLSLKEGLTVFRDQEFSMDQSSRGLIRIENVQDLRSAQFSEDAGPNAHPIRPAYCYAVDNFFTSTIYEKGSEVIRMMQTMVGRPGFRKGMDLYFSRHDGQAVIIEDFAKAISEANHENWDQFKLWYSQAGTPKVEVSESYHAATQEYQLEIRQSCEKTSHEQTDGLDKKPFHIPLVMGLMNSAGQELELSPLSLSHLMLKKNSEGQTLLHLKNETEVLKFTGIKEKPVLSMNRQFSAPIHLEIKTQSTADYLFLMENDSDSFNRWDAAQKIYLQAYKDQLNALKKQTPYRIPDGLVNSLRKILASNDIDNAMKAELILTPSLDYWLQMENQIRGDLMQKAADLVMHQMAESCEDLFLKIYETYHGKNVRTLSNQEFANRRLKNRALSYLGLLTPHASKVFKQFQTAESMTDYQAAFGILIDLDLPERLTAIESFYQKWQNDSLVLNKWFAIQAHSHHPDTFARVQKLLDHPAFNIKNPNRVYSLLRTFGANFSQFHQMNHNPYDFYADQIIEIDRMNPQVAARLAGNFDIWTQLDFDLKDKAHSALEKMLQSGLSSNTHEIIKNNLDAGK